VKHLHSSIGYIPPIECEPQRVEKETRKLAGTQCASWLRTNSDRFEKRRSYLSPGRYAEAIEH
jgi:hypothetical protein